MLIQIITFNSGSIHLHFIDGETENHLFSFCFPKQFSTLLCLALCPRKLTSMDPGPCTSLGVPTNEGISWREECWDNDSHPPCSLLGHCLEVVEFFHLWYNSCWRPGLTDTALTSPNNELSFLCLRLKGGNVSSVAGPEVTHHYLLVLFPSVLYISSWWPL